ncbi:MAG: hypothetical protein HFJ52_02460 [Clostridia bacterium]|nr:hypothetical protein [Clostridia bacterium]
MIKTKEQIITEENIPNINKLYAEYLLERAQRAEEAIERGEYITLEELKKSIDEWEAKYEATHTQRSK